MVPQLNQHGGHHVQTFIGTCHLYCSSPRHRHGGSADRRRRNALVDPECSGGETAAPRSQWGLPIGNQSRFVRGEVRCGLARRSHFVRHWGQRCAAVGVPQCLPQRCSGGDLCTSSKSLCPWRHSPAVRRHRGGRLYDPPRRDSTRGARSRMVRLCVWPTRREVRGDDWMGHRSPLLGRDAVADGTATCSVRSAWIGSC